MFVKNILTLMTGGVVANIISVITIPIVSRLFEPDDFGAFTLFFSIISVSMILLTLRYEHAIVLPDNEKEAEDLFLLSCYLLFVLTLASVLFVFVIYYFYPDMSWIKILGGWFLFLPLGAFLISLGNIAVSYNTRLKMFKHIAVSGVAQVGAVSGTRIGFGMLMGSSLDFLLLGQFVGSLSRIYVLLKHVYRKSIAVSVMLERERVGYLLKKYIQFPLYSLPTGLLRSAALALPVFILAFMFTPAIVGFYGMATRLARLPVSLFGEPIRRTYLQKAAEMLNNNDNLFESLTKLTAALLAIGIVIYLPLYMWGGVIFEFVLGRNWAEAGVLVSILSPWFFMLFVQSASAVVYVVQQKQNVLLKIQLVSVISMLCLFLYAYFYQFNSTDLLVGISVLGVITNLVIIIYAYKIIIANPAT